MNFNRRGYSVEDGGGWKIFQKKQMEGRLFRNYEKCQYTEKSLPEISGVGCIECTHCVKVSHHPIGSLSTQYLRCWQESSRIDTRS